ncbi:MAG: hypothetical protein WC836_12040 [Desulfobacula sp.]|jgi:hypothetical protein
MSREELTVSDEKTTSQKLIYLLCTFLFCLIFIIDLFTPLGVADGVSYISVVLVSLWSTRKNFTLMVSVLSSILTIAGYYLSPPGGELWKVLMNRGLALFAIWVTAFITLQRKAMDEKRIEALRREQQILEDTKILRGLLPICASCKKIRDDKGYWNRIETYIESHSDAQFSHGLCRDCMEKLYGDQDWYKKRKTKQDSE